MKTRLFVHKLSHLLLLCSLIAITPTFTSCKGSKDKAGEAPADKKKQKAKKCPEKSCQVRMTHYHQGAKYKGKRGCFFVKLFTPKESKYGQGLYRNHGNPKSQKRKKN